MHRWAAIVLVAIWVLQVGGTSCCPGCGDSAHCLTTVACQTCAAQGIVPTVAALPSIPQTVTDFEYRVGIDHPSRSDIWRPPRTKTA